MPAKVCECTPIDACALPAVSGDGCKICLRITKPASYFSTPTYNLGKEYIGDVISTKDGAILGIVWTPQLDLRGSLKVR